MIFVFLQLLSSLSAKILCGKSLPLPQTTFRIFGPMIAIFRTTAIIIRILVWHYICFHPADLQPSCENPVRAIASLVSDHISVFRSCNRHLPKKNPNLQQSFCDMIFGLKQLTSTFSAKFRCDQSLFGLIYTFWFHFRFVKIQNSRYWSINFRLLFDMIFCYLQVITSCEKFVDVLELTINRKAQERAACTKDSKSGRPFQ